MTPILKALTDARELISEPVRWTQGEYAKTAKGRCIGAKEKNAACWCAVGALMKTAGGQFMDAREALASATGHTVELFNDFHTHKEVLAAFDRAIAIYGSSAPAN